MFNVARISSSPGDLELSTPLDDASCDGAFLCPLDKKIMTNPVRLICSGNHYAGKNNGYTFHRANIEAWFAAGNTTHPITKLPITEYRFERNHAIRNHIIMYSNQVIEGALFAATNVVERSPLCAGTAVSTSAEQPSFVGMKRLKEDLYMLPGGRLLTISDAKRRANSAVGGSLLCAAYAVAPVVDKTMLEGKVQEVKTHTP